MGKLFGTDGIRGVANEHPMTAEMAMNIGRATAHLFKKKGHVPKIIIGKDTRLSGYMLENALVSGICSMGVNAILVGVIPTPGIAFLTNSMRADAGIVISASHNPFQDNGIKIFSSDGFKLPDETEGAIEEIIFANNLHTLHPSPSELGKAYRMDDARGRYIVFLKHTFPKEYSLEGSRIVLDCSNGATYRVAPDTFSELGAEVSTLFDEPNGKNINLHCGSQHPESLAEEVLKTKADVGFAFDGDGDRLIAVDETGTVLTGDQILAICASVMKKEGSLTNNLVVRTVMSNIGLSVALQKLNIDSLMTKVGDRYVLEEMQARGASIGGEDSGHLIFLQHHIHGRRDRHRPAGGGGHEKGRQTPFRARQDHEGLSPGADQRDRQITARHRHGARDHGRHPRRGGEIGGAGTGPGPLFRHSKYVPGHGGRAVAGKDGRLLQTDRRRCGKEA